MAKYLTWWLLRFLTVILAVGSLVGGIDFDALQQDVPPEELLSFIKYHISKGYQLKAPYEPAYPQYADDFSVELYEYFLTNHQITDNSTLREVENTICFPSGECIDIDDPGVVPEV